MADSVTPSVAPKTIQDIVNASHILAEIRIGEAGIRPSDIALMFPGWGDVYISHGIILEKGSTASSYGIVERHLCNSLMQSSRHDTDNSKCSVDETFRSILSYLGLLQSNFTIEPAKIQRLKISLMGTLIKIDEGLAQTLAAQDVALSEAYVIAEAQMLQKTVYN